jgi:hypothetical protein
MTRDEPRMARPIRLRRSDLQGAVRLSADATTGIVDLVEAMHERIARVPGLSGALDGRTRGITGLVYKTIRGVTRLAGGGADALFDLLAPALAPDNPSRDREAILAALNGVLGDHLAATGNPLATMMSLRRDGRPLVLDASALEQTVPGIGGKPLVLLHGLCMNDLQWSRDGHDHGAALAGDRGYTPVYLHYNTGLHLAANGEAFAQQMEQLVAAWPHRIERLTLLCHSMGGLVARAAFESARAAGHRWPSQVNDLVFLGTPHHGAPLERAGHWVDIVLSGAPYAAPFARLSKVRSAGITDLRHGLDLPLPKSVRCYAAAGSIGDDESDLKGRLLGDGLVPLDSALGRHADPARQLGFAKSRLWVGRSINHMQLLSRAEVYAQLRKWLG